MSTIMTIHPLLETPVPLAPASPILGTYKRAPMEFVRGAGVELFDSAGKAYLDMASGIAVNALGYGDSGIRGAILGALDSGMIHVSNLYRSRPGEELAQALVRQSFAEQVFFCNSGAEANEGAFKFARRWGRSIAAPAGDELGVFGACAKHEIVSLRGAFHGRTMGVLAATDRPAYRAPFRPLAGGIAIAERDIKELERTLDEERVAAVI